MQQNLYIKDNLGESCNFLSLIGRCSLLGGLKYTKNIGKLSFGTSKLVLYVEVFCIVSLIGGSTVYSFAIYVVGKHTCVCTI